MYSPKPRPAIILNSERPAGRRRFTCGHEIGHHVFEHGYRIDELNDENSSTASPEEYLAQRFSSALLMPKIAVDSAFARRGWSPSDAQAQQFFTVAQELGVGFTTLVTNAEVNLRTISTAEAETLRRTSLPKLRQQIVGMPVTADVFQVDEHWIQPTVDGEVGDIVIIPQTAKVQGVCASRQSTQGGNVVATAPGTATITLASGQKALTLRVSKVEYVGLARYRHLEESSDE